MTAAVGERRRRQVLDALRRGTVPQQGLDLLAVGLDRFTANVDSELAAVSGGESAFKAVSGDRLRHAPAALPAGRARP